MGKLLEEKQNKGLLILLSVTAILITVTGIIFKQDFFNMLPLYISLVVYVLQANVNRIAYLVGAVNSIIYAAVYIHYSLYASAASAVCMSFTVQIITYFLWKKRACGKSTRFRKLTNIKRVILLFAMVCAWVIINFFLSKTNAAYKELDTALSIIGFANSFLTMFAFIEYAPLMVISQALSIILYSVMMLEHPEQITYLVFACYGLSCQIFAFKNVISTYNKQQKEKPVN